MLNLQWFRAPSVGPRPTVLDPLSDFICMKRFFFKFISKLG